jgi:hypothetical protein
MLDGTAELATAILGMGAVFILALVATRTEDDIRQKLQRKGYTTPADAASADFTVDFTIDTQERIGINEAVSSVLAKFAPA